MNRNICTSQHSGNKYTQHDSYMSSHSWITRHFESTLCLDHRLDFSMAQGPYVGYLASQWCNMWRISCSKITTRL